jgi:uroporphyrinogen-III synthase
MTVPALRAPRRWRVAVTRDEAADGPLSRALAAGEFEPWSCPVLVERPPADPEALARLATTLDSYDWVVCASVRSVRALAHGRTRPWPAGVRTAAVGAQTARALQDAGATPAPLAGDGDGADALWTRLRDADTWPGRRVLVATTPGGRRVLAEALAAAGAQVDEVETYQMEVRPTAAIVSDWRAAAPDAAVIASPRVAAVLVDVLGASALRDLRGVVAIGHTTASALTAASVPAAIADAADFAAGVRALAGLRAREAGR